MANTTEAASTSQATAGLNQVFICRACSRAFMDREASTPVAINMRGAIGVQERTPHAKYPDDRDLDTVSWKDTPDQEIKLPAADAQDCCADHTVLCNSNRLRFRREADGATTIVGAEYLE